MPSPAIPSGVAAVLDRLTAAGHAAYLVGGCVRDRLLGREPLDWDAATDARPERLLELFPGTRYENRFGTVTVEGVQVTTFRRDHRYADRRRPDAVTFTDSLEEDLVRRDFTVNAMAWGWARGDDAPAWVDPAGGRADLAARRLRAVGDPAERFDEDALRLLRAARLAAQLNFEIEPVTAAAMRVHGDLVRHVSSERVGQELGRLLENRPPSRGFRILEERGILEPLAPDLAAQRGIPQNKIRGHDLWDHTLATLDAASVIAPGGRRLALAALLHDIGKPATSEGGHFVGHDVVGARLAEAFLTRIAVGRSEALPIARLIRHHMFGYEPAWSDAAVRRFMRRVGTTLVDDLIRLRAADNVGSGLPPGAGQLDELRARIAAEHARKAPLSLTDLAIDGNTLMAELGLAPGPMVGNLLERLLDSVISDPDRNTRERLVADARRWLAGGEDSARPPGGTGSPGAQVLEPPDRTAVSP